MSKLIQDPKEHLFIIYIKMVMMNLLYLYIQKIIRLQQKFVVTKNVNNIIKKNLMIQNLIN